MPRQESTDMATAKSRTPIPSSESETRDNLTSRLIRDVLLQAIKLSGLSLYALAKAAGIDERPLRLFVREGKPLALVSADKLAVVLGLRLASQVQEPGTGDDHSLQTFSEDLRSAITSAMATGLSLYALARASGVHEASLRLFVRKGRSLALASADKLAAVLGLSVARVAKASPQQPEASLDTVPQLFSEGLRSAIKDSPLSPYYLNKASGIHLGAIYRFIRGETSLAMASADKLAAVLGLSVASQESGACDHLSSQSFSDAIRSAIASAMAGGLSIYALAKAAGIDDNALYRFVHGETSLALASADKLAAVLGLSVARVAKPQGPQSKAPIDNPLQPIFNALRSEIKDSGLSVYELAKRSGVTTPSIYGFLAGRDIKHFTVIKLADALGCKLGPMCFQVSPVQTPIPVEFSAVGPTSTPRDFATNKDYSIDQTAFISQASPSARVEPARRCPVELRGEGFPIRVYGKDVPLMNGVAYAMLKKVVEAFHRGGGCLPSNLFPLTDSKRLRPFTRALDRAGFEPLRRVIPNYKGGRGRTIEIVDVGPDL